MSKSSSTCYSRTTSTTATMYDTDDVSTTLDHTAAATEHETKNKNEQRNVKKSNIEERFYSILQHILYINKYGFRCPKKKGQIDWNQFRTSFQLHDDNTDADTHTDAQQIARSKDHEQNMNLLGWLLRIDGGPPLDVIHMVLQAYPDAAKEKGEYYGRTPLHWGMAKRAPLNVVTACLKAYPHAAKEQDFDQKTPLHLGLQNGASVNVIQTILDVFPAAAKEKTKEGMTPLHSGMEAGARLDAIQPVLEAYPNAALEQDYYGRTPLHCGMQKGVSLQIIQALLQACPSAANVIDQQNQSPLDIGMEWAAPADVIQVILRACPNAAMQKDNDHGMTPLHWQLIEGAPLHIIRAFLEACPDAAKAEDDYGRTPLFCAIEEGNCSNIEILKLVYDHHPPAAHQEEQSGVCPVRFLISKLVDDNDDDSALDSTQPKTHNDICRTLQILLKGLRDGRRLQQLCVRDDSPALQYFFSIMEEKMIRNQQVMAMPALDLNHEPIPSWTLLEILADIGTEEASNIFFQIKAQLQSSEKTNALVSISNKTGRNVAARFLSTAQVKEETWRKVADCAKKSHNEELREWGEKHERFLNKYLIQRDDDPKHVSDTSVVVFATELCIDSDGRKREVKVALKFMTDEAAFCREISTRLRILSLNTPTNHKHVVDIKAAYTSREEENFSFQKDKHFEIHFGKNFSRELMPYNKIRLRNCGRNKHKGIFRYLVVMDCGTGKDLSDSMMHQNITGMDIGIVSHVATSVAECLQYLNEGRNIMHGDVKPRNFIAQEGVSARYMAIDLNNACAINEQNAQQIRTSSGYLPPEQAVVEYSRRVTNRDPSCDVLEESQVEISQLQEELAHLLNTEDVDLLDDNTIAHRGRLASTLRLAKERAEEHLHITSLPNVRASAQYDMWCFGVLLYQICTGRKLFNMNDREEVDDDELKTIRDWSDVDFEENFKRLPQGCGWGRIRQLLENLLQRDADKRPRDWGEIIQMLGQTAMRETDGAVEPAKRYGVRCTWCVAR